VFDSCQEFHLAARVQPSGDEIERLSIRCDEPGPGARMQDERPVLGAFGLRGCAIGAGR
jgi:hypothetical protein